MWGSAGDLADDFIAWMEIPMNRWHTAILVGALVLASAAANAQTTQRVRGTITAVDGKVLSVKSRDGKDVKLALTDATTYAYPVVIKLSDIKPGDYVGTAAMPGADGKLVAREVHLFAPAARGTGEGSYAWDSEPGSTMTNANLAKMVKASSGDELSLEYKGGAKTVVVPPGTPIVKALPGDRSLLRPGAYVFAVAQVATDGALTATRIQAEKDGVKPPQ
jgi:hypothetical protein